MSELITSSWPQGEWTYLEDSLGIVYCLGRSHSTDKQDAVAAYYHTNPINATKQTLDSSRYYRRLVYQGLPEEHERLTDVEDVEIVKKLLDFTGANNVGIVLDPSQLLAGDSVYRNVSHWLGSDHPKATSFQSALEISCRALESTGINVDMMSLYGAASFGLVGTTPRRVEDIDIVLSTEDLPALKNTITELRSSFRWSEIDPYDRLTKNRQLLKAKRWATSQVRLTNPYPVSIDLKAAREPGAKSLWDDLPKTGIDVQNTNLELKVVDDSEAFCTSPALICEDKAGDGRVLLLEGYQYIGCAAVGDVIEVRGETYQDSSLIHVTQAEAHFLLPDFRNAPLV